MELNLEHNLFEELQLEEMGLIDGGVNWDSVGGASIGAVTPF